VDDCGRYFARPGEEEGAVSIISSHGYVDLHDLVDCCGGGLKLSRAAHWESAIYTFFCGGSCCPNQRIALEIAAMKGPTACSHALDPAVERSYSSPLTAFFNRLPACGVCSLWSRGLVYDDFQAFGVLGSRTPCFVGLRPES